MKFKYYKAVGERAEEVKQKIKEEYEKCRDARRLLMKKYGADGLVYKGGHVIAITYLNDVSKDDAFKFLERNAYLERYSKEKCYAFEPNRRYKKGKKLFADMQECKEFDYSMFACTYFEVETTVLEYSPRPLGTFHISVSGTNGNGDLVFKIPYDDKEKFPKIPDDLVEITEKEFFNAGAEKDESN